MASSKKKHNLDDLLSGDIPQGIVKKGPGLHTSIDPVITETPDTKEVKPVKLLKRSMYLTAEQDQKLDELAAQYRKATGEQANRMDIVRMMVDHATLDTLLEKKTFTL